MIRSTSIIAAIMAVVALIALPTASASAATVTAKVNANVVKPLVFSAKQDLDFGTISLPTTIVPLTVTVTTTGTRICPPPLVCTGIAKQAIFNVQGSNGQVIRIAVAASDLVNAADGKKLVFTPVAPLTVTLTNSGSPGRDFDVGGSIVIPTTATAGLYTGDIEVTADYP